MRCTIVKSYPTHRVHYEGYIDENGIWGNWQLNFNSGGFHLWPKEGAVANKRVEKESLVAKS